jgi:septal ring factor EnvC (AmiA/AmiB activator)
VTFVTALGAAPRADQAPVQTPVQTPAAPAQADAAQARAEEARAKALATRASDRIRALRQEADALAAQERTLLVELRQLDVQRDLKAAELARIDADLAATTAELHANEGERTRLEALVAKQTPEIRGRLVELYKLGRAGYWRLLLDVDDLREIGRAYRKVSALSRADQTRISEHRRTLAALAASRESLARRHADERALREKAATARAALERAVAARQARIDEIDRRRDLAAQLTGELQLAQQRLQAALTSLARGEPAAVSLPITPFRGDLNWPVDGRIVTTFGRQSPGTGSMALQRTGVELEAVEGTSVRAIHGGTVAYADAFTGFGHLAIVDHGHETYSLYGYLGSLSVTKGDQVEAHTVLGAVGRPPTGASARLYFEIRVDGVPVDPVEWLKAR